VNALSEDCRGVDGRENDRGIINVGHKRSWSLPLALGHRRCG